MNHILNRYLPFLMKSPLFCLFWTLFGQFSGTFPIRPVSKSPWLLNWIIFWIESAEFFLNWIIFWIESWVKRYWIEYWMNHFLAKFKHWIESDRVSNTPTITAKSYSTSTHMHWLDPSRAKTILVQAAVKFCFFVLGSGQILLSTLSCFEPLRKGQGKAGAGHCFRVGHYWSSSPAKKFVAQISVNRPKNWTQWSQ